MRKELLMGNWLFLKSKVELKEVKNTKFETVTLPHTWNNIDGQDGGNDYVRTVSTYVRNFNHKKTNERVYLDFEGVNSISNVYLNSKHLGEHRGGYSTFRYDITDIVVEKDNELVVYVDNTHQEDVYPLNADFTFYGGIYRDVSIIHTNEVAFDLTHKGAKGVYISQKQVSHEKAVIGVSSYVLSTCGLVEVQVKAELIDDDGKIVSSHQQRATVQSKSEVAFDLTLDQPHLWNGIKDPYLYTLKVTLIHHGVEIDSREIKTGLRFYSFDNEAFYLNGVRTRLDGVSRHQDRKGVGNALTNENHDEDIALIVELGANSIRLAHYQQSDYFYDLCDREGLVIWAEIPYISISSRTDTTGSNALAQMEELVIQNYNHSSILMWGISNEITIAKKANNVDEILVKLNDLTHKLDPYRVTTMAHVSMLPVDDIQTNLSDVHGYNHYFGWYGGKVEDFVGWLELYRNAHPEKGLCLSEYGVEGIIKLHSETPQVKDYSEEYHALWHEKAYTILQNTPFVWGTYVWNMFAFAADFRDEGGSKGMNNKGLVTFDRKIKKDAFYFYQARWSTKPMLHLNAKRFVDRATDEIKVKAYSNLKEVQFFVNDELVDTVKANDNIFETTIKLVKGQNKVTVKSGNLKDETVFNKVDQENESYKVPKDEANKGVFNINIPANWFDEVGEEEIVIDEAYFSVKDSIASILAHEEGKKVLTPLISDLIKHPFFVMIQEQSFEQMKGLAGDSLKPSVYAQINKILQKIKK